MGAEIGNSTQKLHARGPIGMRELTTFKYVARGDGQIRECVHGRGHRRAGVGLQPPAPRSPGAGAGGALAARSQRGDPGPDRDAPHKRIADDPGPELRMAMTRLAAADDARFSVSSLEVDREGPSYTYETLELLAKERGQTELVFVMGADAAVGLESWRNPERVVELARAGGRAPGRASPTPRSAAVLRSLGAEGRATMLEMPQFGVSSSAVRERAAAGRPLRYLVPEPVARFIEEKGVYA